LPARAATCYPRQSLDQISDSVMACERQIGEAGAKLDSPDPAVRKKAQQSIYSALGVLHAEESFLKSMSPDQRVRDNLAQIADVQDIHKEDLQKARQAASGGATPEAKPTQPDPAGGKTPGAAPQAAAGGGAVGPVAGAGAGSGGGAGGGGTGDGATPDGGGTGGGPGGSAGGAGAAGGAGGSAGNPVVAGHSADDSAPAKDNAGAAHAQKLGDALKAGLAQDPGGFSGGPGGDGMSRAGFGAAAGGAGAAGAPLAGGGSGQMLASIGSGGAMSLQAAAASGLGASFRSMGLKMGPGGSVLHEDGTPASAAEVAQLRERLASDPQALLKNPGLFDVLSRDKFDRLKSDYKDKPEQREDAFKHVGVTKDDRDFVHTASCDKDLESGCNKHTKSKRYRMGDYVSPEDLKAIDEALHPEDAQNASAGSPAAAYDGASPDEKPALAGPEPEPAAPSGVVARLGSLLARLRGDSAPERPARAGAPGRAARPAAAARTAARAAGIPTATLALYAFSAAGLAFIGGVWVVATRRRRGFMER
jgi:hypothetical protein